MKISYMFGSEFSERIYRVWLGYDGEEKVSYYAGALTGPLISADTYEKNGHRPHLCLPPMFLHPVKNTKR